MARKLTYNELEKDLLACKNAKEVAVKDKEELACIFNAIPDHIAIIDNQFKIQRVNRALADTLKCSPEELKGKPCYRYICKADRPPASCPHARMIADGKVHTSENYNNQLGMNMLVTSSPLYDDKGRLIGGVLTARDTKIYRETEEAEIESE